MTEQEYIDATNLAKVRAALAIVREILPGSSGVTQVQQGVITGILCEWSDHLFRNVSIDPEGP